MADSLADLDSPLHPAHFPVEQQVWRWDADTAFDHDPITIIVCGCNENLALPIGHEGYAE